MGEDEEKEESKMVPLRMLYETQHHLNGPDSSSSSSSSRFPLPQGWAVKLVLRSNHTKKFDKYYYEPSTKKMFRSRREIEKYLNGEEITRRRKSLGYHHKLTTGNFGPEKMIMPRGRLPTIDKKEVDQAVVALAATADTPPFTLPEGWVVEKVPRKHQGSDKYYYEPGTGRKFRSLVEVERHLQEKKREKAPLSHMFEISNYGKKRKEVGMSSYDSVEPPDKIIWILKDSGGQAWSPLMGKTFVPHPIRNQWAFKFLQLMSNKNVVAPNLKRWKS